MTDRGGHKKRISPDDRRELINRYYQDGVDAAVRFGQKLGLGERYVIRLAQSRALHEGLE